MAMRLMRWGAACCRRSMVSMPSSGSRSQSMSATQPMAFLSAGENCGRRSAVMYSWNSPTNSLPGTLAMASMAAGTTSPEEQTLKTAWMIWSGLEGELCMRDIGQGCGAVVGGGGGGISAESLGAWSCWSKPSADMFGTAGLGRTVGSGLRSLKVSARGSTMLTVTMTTSSMTEWLLYLERKSGPRMGQTAYSGNVGEVLGGAMVEQAGEHEGLAVLQLDFGLGAAGGERGGW